MSSLGVIIHPVTMVVLINFSVNLAGPLPRYLVKTIQYVSVKKFRMKLIFKRVDTEKAVCPPWPRVGLSNQGKVSIQ